MNQKLYLLCCILLGAMFVTGAFAQGSGSRLHMATKAKATKLEKSPLSYSPYKVSSQPLILEKSKAVSTYYRTLLFGNNDTAAAEESRDNEASQSPVPQVYTPKPVSFENVSQENDNLYINDRISVKNLFPNPANDFALLQYNMAADVKEAKISLYNVLGATVKEYSLNRQSQQLNVDTRSLPNGVYFYQLTVDGQKVATKKLLVRHHQ
jgi:hypothetical protein